jgi:hypothetical protein
MQQLGLLGILAHLRLLDALFILVKEADLLAMQSAQERSFSRPTCTKDDENVLVVQLELFDVVKLPVE